MAKDGFWYIASTVTVAMAMTPVANSHHTRWSGRREPTSAMWTYN